MLPLIYSNKSVIQELISIFYIHLLRYADILECYVIVITQDEYYDFFVRVQGEGEDECY